MACALGFGCILAILALVVWLALGQVSAVRERQGPMLQAALDAPVALRTYALVVFAEGRRDGVPLRAMLLLNPLVWAGTPTAPKAHLQLSASLLGASPAFLLGARFTTTSAKTIECALSLTGDAEATAALNPALRDEALALVRAWTRDDDTAWEIRAEGGQLVLTAPAPVSPALVTRAAALLIGLRAAILEALERRARGGVADAGYRGGVRVELAEAESDEARVDDTEGHRERARTTRR